MDIESDSEEDDFVKQARLLQERIMKERLSKNI